MCCVLVNRLIAGYFMRPRLSIWPHLSYPSRFIILRRIFIHREQVVIKGLVSSVGVGNNTYTGPLRPKAQAIWDQFRLIFCTQKLDRKLGCDPVNHLLNVLQICMYCQASTDRMYRCKKCFQSLIASQWFVLLYRRIVQNISCKLCIKYSSSSVSIRL